MNVLAIILIYPCRYWCCCCRYCSTLWSFFCCCCYCNCVIVAENLLPFFFLLSLLHLVIAFFFLHCALCHSIWSAHAQCDIMCLILLMYVAAYVQKHRFLIHTHQTLLPYWCCWTNWIEVKNELILQDCKLNSGLNAFLFYVWLLLCRNIYGCLCVCVCMTALIKNSKIETIPMRMFLIRARIDCGFGHTICVLFYFSTHMRAAFQVLIIEVRNRDSVRNIKHFVQNLFCRE